MTLCCQAQVIKTDQVSFQIDAGASVVTDHIDLSAVHGPKRFAINCDPFIGLAFACDLFCPVIDILTPCRNGEFCLGRTLNFSFE